MTRRQQRLNQQFREEISELLLHQLKDPRLSGLVSVTEVSISADMRHAMVFISVLGDEEQKQRVFQGVAAASRFIRRELSQRLEIRRIPELEFRRDDTIERGAHILDLIKQVAASAEKRPPK